MTDRCDNVGPETAHMAVAPTEKQAAAGTMEITQAQESDVPGILRLLAAMDMLKNIFPAAHIQILAANFSPLFNVSYLIRFVALQNFRTKFEYARYENLFFSVSLSQIVSIGKMFVIRNADGQVQGFASYMSPEEAAKDHLVPILYAEMFPELYYRDKKLKEYRYCIVGQICIAREQRESGLLRQLVAKLVEACKAEGYTCAIGQIDARNTRSRNAHIRGLGAEVIEEKVVQLEDGGRKSWVTVVYNFDDPKPQLRRTDGEVYSC